MPAAPMRMLFAVALLALYACFAGWLAFREHSWPYALVAVAAALGCVTAAMLKPWSRFIVYLLNIAFLAAWGYFIHAYYRTGALRLLSNGRLARLLAPDTVMVLLICYCSYAVFINFRERR